MHDAAFLKAVYAFGLRRREVIHGRPRRSDPRASTSAAAARGWAYADRAVVTRYDKLAVRLEATVHIAVINEWLPLNL
jgi:hypothetical protein